MAWYGRVYHILDRRGQDVWLKEDEDGSLVRCEKSKDPAAPRPSSERDPCLDVRHSEKGMGSKEEPAEHTQLEGSTSEQVWRDGGNSKL